MTDQMGPPEAKLAGRFSAMTELMRTVSSQDTVSREGQIADLAGTIIQIASAPLLREATATKEIQPLLEQAVAKAHQTEFTILGSTKTELPWTGSDTLVVINKRGNIAGFHQKEDPEIAKDYGDVTPYAMVKAMSLLHLEKAGLKGGLTKPENFRYLASLGLTPFEKLFTGAASEPIFISGEAYFLGASGSAARAEYRTGLLGGATPGPNSAAGAVDSAFCDVVGLYLANPNRPVSPIPEPSYLQQIRIGN